MKVWKCNKCGKEIEIIYDSYTMSQKNYPDGWVLVRVYSKQFKKGGKSKVCHFCEKCKKEIFGGD